ncbi:hypothetical protein LSTR_LSTR014915 [Laodelphax striatellus]|uniref:Cytochrome P450 n=1 Tax=Laodelphax striatellus TaxID=195883 RepID=A0A482XP78_LAOST|nr:hypothetical protein LSTR_LSTR014915 [Laodelphax striatellus]
MTELLGSTWLNYLVAIVLLIISILVFIKVHIYSHWKRRGIIQANASPPWGSIKNFVLGRTSIAEVFAEIYKQGEGHPIIGFYSFLSPALVIREPDYMKRILVRDYDHFSDRGIYSNRKIDPLSYHLFSTDGPHHKEMRYMLSTDTRKPLSLDEIAAQTFLFILGGHETSSAAICFLLYEMALNPDIQARLHEEIDTMDGNINYDNIKEMEYLNMVFNETLRKYPAAPTLIRLCVKDYMLPNGFLIKKGTQVMVPVYGLHWDAKYFPQPDKFDPERFSPKAPTHQIQPFTFLPFGEGPRYCIGKRFGVASVKLGVTSILSKFRIELAENTKIPMKIESKTFITNPYKGLTLKLVARNT